MSLFDSPWWTWGAIPALIFLARVLDVSLGTMRIVFVSRGLRTPAPLIGFFEVLIWLLAIGQVVQNLDRPINYLAYAGGFAMGTWTGLMLEEKMALGLLSVRIITREDASELLERLREAEFGATSVAARGLKGRVRLIFSVIRRRELEELMDLVRGRHPRAFVSVSDVRLASEGHFGSGGMGYPRMLEMLWKK